ncbi:MAG: hypothetical protein Q8K75_02945 [Chlamydiales bacterium]|nr:hypothetical protein [Chlamydiales bacterium]
MIGDSPPLHNDVGVHNDQPINNAHNNPPPPGIDPHAPPAPMPNGNGVKRGLSSEPSKIAKGILKALNNNRVLIVSVAGLGVMALGAGLMISFAFVPSVGIGLIIGGAFLASAGVTVALLAPLLDPVVDKGIGIVIEGSKVVMDAIRDNPKLAEIREKFNKYAASCCGRIHNAIDDSDDFIKRGVNDVRTH